MDLGLLLESPQGSQSSSRVGACTCAFLQSCSSSVTLPCAWIKGSVAFPRGLPRRLSHRAVPLATIPRVPQMSQSIPGKSVFPALPRLSSRGSTHTAVTRGSALWESLVGKPREKASWESLVGKSRGKATDPLIHAKGSMTLLLKLGRKAHVHGPTRDED